MTGIRVRADTPYAVSHLDQANLILYWIVNIRMQRPRNGYKPDAPGGGRLYAATTIRLKVCHLMAAMNELEERLKALKQGPYMKIAPGLDNFITWCIQCDPAVGQSQRAHTISDEDCEYRVNSSDYQRNFAWSTKMTVNNMMIKVMEFLAGVPAVRQTEMLGVLARNFFPAPPNKVTKVGSDSRSRTYRNSSNQWGVMHFFGQDGKGEEVSFTKNIMHFVREEMCYYNIEDSATGRMLVPIASAVIMLLMAHSLLEASSTNGSTCPSLFKKAGTDTDGKDLRVSDCFEVDEKTWIVTKVKFQPLYNQFYGTACVLSR
jgi:hypothetical protein